LNQRIKVKNSGKSLPSQVCFCVQAWRYGDIKADTSIQQIHSRNLSCSLADLVWPFLLQFRSYRSYFRSSREESAVLQGSCCMVRGLGFFVIMSGSVSDPWQPLP